MSEEEKQEEQDVKELHQEFMGICKNFASKGFTPPAAGFHLTRWIATLLYALAPTDKDAREVIQDGIKDGKSIGKQHRKEFQNADQ
jgi:hypothetical protein